MTCRNNCFHYEVCRQFEKVDGSNLKYYDYTNKAETCECFRNRADYMRNFVGETMFIVVGEEIREYEITDITCDKITIWAKGLNRDYAADIQSVNRCISRDLGNTIFFTRTDAEREINKHKGEKRK